jgi:hypothetical protein
LDLKSRLAQYVVPGGSFFVGKGREDAGSTVPKGGISRKNVVFRPVFRPFRRKKILAFPVFFAYTHIMNVGESGLKFHKVG